MHSSVMFTPMKNGEYRISIKLEGIDISSSPHRGIAIDGTSPLPHHPFNLLLLLVLANYFLETTPKISELVFSQDWVVETTQLYSLLAQRGM